MLHTHGRYDYSNILERPDYSWPGGKRLAVYVAVNIEQFRYGAGKGAAIPRLTRPTAIACSHGEIMATVLVSGDSLTSSMPWLSPSKPR